MNGAMKIGLIVVLSCVVSAILIAGVGFVLLVAWVVNENTQQQLSESKNDTSESQSPQKKEKGFKSSLNNKVLDFAIRGWNKVHCSYKIIDKWQLTNEYTRYSLSGDEVYFLEYTYTWAEKLTKIEDLYSREQLERYRKEDLKEEMEALENKNKRILEGHKETGTITLRITKRGNKWFILGEEPPPEPDIKIIGGEFVDCNKEEYPTLLE